MNTDIHDLQDQHLDLATGGVIERPGGGGCTDPVEPKDPPLPLMPELLGAN